MKRIAIITNHDDDIYCFRRELIEKLYDDGHEIIISCPYGEKLDLLDNIKFELDKRGGKIKRKWGEQLFALPLFFIQYQRFSTSKPTPSSTSLIASERYLL